jgi:hypothetical protein
MFSFKKIGIQFSVLFLFAALLWQGNGFLVVADDDDDFDQYKVDFSLQEIRDPQMNNEVAVTIAIPDGWKIKNPNVVQWNPVTYGDPARIAVELNGEKDEVYCEMFTPLAFRYDYGTASVGKQLEQKEDQLWQQVLEMSRRTGYPPPPRPQRQILEYKEFVPDDGWIVRKPLSAEEFVRQLLDQNKEVSNIKIKKVSKPKLIVAELNRELPKLNQQMIDLLRQAGSTMPFKGVTADTALVEFTCSKDGKRYEQRIGVTISYLRTASPCNILTGANDDSVMWTVWQFNSVYALAGKLKKHEVEITTIFGESKINPIWQAKVNYLSGEVIRIIGENRIKEQMKINEQILKTQKYIAETSRSVFENKAKALSNTSNGWANVLSGREILNYKGNKYRVPIGAFNSNNLPNGATISNW